MKNNFQSKSVPRGTRTIWRYLSALFILFTFAIGQMWGADPTHTNPATATYGGKTFLDAANTPGNAGTENVYLNYGVIGMYNNLSTFTWLTYNKFDKSNNSYSLPTGAVGFCTPGSSSSSEFYGNVNFNTNDKTSWIKIYVTGTEEIGFIWENNNTTNNRHIVYTLSEIDSEGEETGTPQTTTGKSPLATGKQYDKFSSLNHSKYYCITISTAGTSSSKFYGITFKRYVAPECTKPGTPGTPSVSSKTHNTANLSWTDAANSDGYKVSIVKKSDASVIVDWTNCATNSYAASGLSPETTYTFKVKAKGASGYCELGDEASADFATEVDPSATTYKVTLVPAGGTISDATGWTLNAGNYEKEVSDGTELALPTFTKANRTFKTWRKAGPTDVTSPITVTADVTLTAVWNATVEEVIYSWEGAQGGATEVGGTAQSSTNGGSSFDNAQINVAQAGYYCIQLNGKNDYSTNIVEITLSGTEKVKAGDKIRYTGFYNHTDTKNAAPKMRASDATAIFTGSNLPNINSASPRTDTHTVPEGINTATVQLTRAQTQSSSFLTKLQIIRPTLVEEANIRTVTFNYNDGGATASTSVEVASGSKVSAPADPTRAHYRFHEWQLGGVAYDFATAVTSNITLVADWTQLYTVTYAKGAEDATGDAPTQDELAAGEKFTVAANTFTYEGHDFSKWNDGTNNYDPSDKYTMGSANVTLTAQWITATTKVTVTYKDGETTLGSEEITINTGNPVGYATYQTRNLATFDGWYNDPDLADGHKIADISALTASADVNVYGKWNYQYASSANIEQWTLDNGKGVSDAQKETQTGALMSLLGTRKYASNIAYDKGNIELDSLNDDPGKTNRNNAYLGLKVKKSGKMLDFRLANGQTVKVKFGATGNYPQVALNGGSYADMSLTDNVWTYTAEGADAYISIKTANNNTVVIKQIMINEPIADVTLPWRVTYDANGGTCATDEAIWSGAALILPDVTPADADHTFAGWYDEVSGGSLQGVAGASYSATDNITLHAQFAPVEYSVTYVGGEGATGSMGPEAKGWGLEYTALANTFEKSGHVFSGWTVTGVDGVSTIPALGSFTMPKNNVTLTALWEDVSKVAVIVETNVKYESLADAVAAATDGQTIQLLQNNNVTAQVEVAGKAITLDLAGYKIEYTGTSTLPSGVILVHNGASLTIDDSSNPDAGSIVSGADAYAAIALTKAGDDAANPAVLEINGGTFTGDYYAITGNGARHNTQITINAGTFSGAHANDNSAIYHPQQGTLIINGGTFTGYSAAIELRAGTLEINDGTFTATATEYSCNPSGSGTTTVGAAIAIAQHNTQKDIAVTINGGTFEGVKAINEANPQGNPAPAVAMSVTDGDFTGEVSTVDVHEFISGGTYDAPVTNENCAYGYVPAPEEVPGVYTVMPKDGVEIIGVVTTGGTNKTVTGLYKGDASVNLDNNKKIGEGNKYIFVTLKEGYTFEENDVLIVDVEGKSDLTSEKALEITTGIGNIDGDVWKTLVDAEYDTGENSISLEGIAAGQTSIGLKRSANQNAKINGLRVLRPMKPMLTAFSVNGRDGVIDEVNKTVAVQIPYESVLSSLTVVPTVIRNEAHATTPQAVISNEGAWIEGANTYRVMDKDGDYTDYIITLTRDVLKHEVTFNTHGGSAVASEEVEDGAYLAAAPAEPTKEDYLFQGWAETADGAIVDVTTFAITADKEFHAVWAAETGVIKLFDGEGNLNTTNFVSAPKNDDPIEIASVEYPCLAQFASNRTSLGGAVPADMVKYDATTDEAKIKMTFYNLNSSVKKAILYKYEEGAEEPVKIEIEVPGQEIYTTDFYEFNSAKNRSFYVCAADRSNIRVLQVKVVDNGANPVKHFGEVGYSLNLNKGRLYAKDGVEKTFEGLTLTVSSEYKVYNNSNLATKAANSFNVPAPTVMSVKRSGGKYYVYQDPADKGTLYSTDAEIELNATGTWYISSETSSSATSFTKIEFLAPKCEKPTVTDMTDVELCTGEPYTELVVNASKSDEGTLHYAWFKVVEGDDDLAVGTDAATYTPAADGEYYVIVTNTLAGHQDNAATSNTISVAHFASVAITTAPEDVYKHSGLDASLSVAATGKSLTYEWFTCDDELGNNPVAIVPAETAADLTLTAIEAGIKYYQVVVTDECGSSASAVAKVEAFDDLPQVDVTEATVWDMANVSASAINLKNDDPALDKQNDRLLLANIDGVNNNASFNAQALMFEGQHIGRTSNSVKHLAGQYVQFNVTVPGMVSVTFASNGSSQRTIQINGKVCSRTTNDGTYITYNVAVEPGSVVIEDVQGYVRISKIEFITAPNYTRTVNPSNIGTLCWTNNAILAGATLYELAGKNEYNKLVFDEVDENRLEAGKAYIFVPENGNTEIKVYNTDNAAALTTPIEVEVGFQGTFVDLSTIEDGQNSPLWGNHIITNNHYLYVDYANCKLGAYRAYIKDLMSIEAPTEPEPTSNGAPRRRLMVEDANAPQVTTGVEGLNVGDQPVKMIIDGQLFILRGEKMYNANGQLVK